MRLGRHARRARRERTRGAPPPGSGGTLTTDVVITALSCGLDVLRRADGALTLHLVGGATALGDAREFAVPLQERHLAALQDSLPRQILARGALLTLCYAAGSTEPLDQSAAAERLELVLSGVPQEIDAHLQGEPEAEQALVVWGGDAELVERGELWAAAVTVTDTPDLDRERWRRVSRDRAARGVVLGPLDIAVLRYTGRYLGTDRTPSRDPRRVDPAMLPAVLEVIGAAERVAAHRRIGPGPVPLDLSSGRRARLDAAVRRALRRDHPQLAEDTVHAVCALMLDEAAQRARPR